MAQNNPNPTQQQTANPQQPAPPPLTPNPAIDPALRYYFLHQGQSIARLHLQLQSNSIARGAKSVFSVLLEIVFYLLFVAAIVAAILLPSNPFAASGNIGNGAALTFSIDLDEVLTFMLVVKGVIAAAGVPFLICAILLGRNRRKSSRIATAFEEADEMKNNFEHAMRTFHF